MKFRQWSILLAIVVITGAVVLMGFLSGQKKSPDRRNGSTVRAKPVKVFRAEMDSVHAEININGRLEAQQRVEIYAEVSGVFQPGSIPFKEGIRYRKGEVLLRLDDEETRMNLLSQKSNLMNQITQMMPDLKLDYPETYEQWNTYLREYDLQKTLQPFPEPTNEKVKYFINSRNLNNLYYTIKSLESRLYKYIIRAPFDGVVTEANIDRGTLVRVGQKLGEFLNPATYELEAAVGIREVDLLNVGDTVHLTSNDVNGNWRGEIIRINNKIDAGTQSVKIYVKLTGENLWDGMYLDGMVQGRIIEDAFRLDRKLVMDDSLVWIARDSTLTRQPVRVLQYSLQDAVVKGLKEDMLVLDNTFPGAYEGMKVEPVIENKMDSEPDSEDRSISY